MPKFMNLRSLLASAVPTIGVSDFQEVLDVVQNQVSPSTIVAVIGVGLAAAVVFVFLWWGIRKLISILMAAFKRGKLRV